ncbi:MAG: FAD-binding protein [Desulfobacteraceae bacterium]|nr:FAD-binding protein [Desulfobacteraceae bacterium]
MNVKDIANVVETDLLIIGGGFGGLFAAIKAKQNGVEDVIIVDKGAVALTGQSRLAAGATIYLHPGDDLEEWVKCLFIGQKGLCNQDMVESYLIQSFDRLREFEEMGIVFQKNPQTDDYFRLPSRGLVPVQMTIYPSYKELVGGTALTAVLRKRALRLGVTFYNKIFINDLIIKDKTTQGAVGCHRRTGDFYVFKSRAVVIAACDCSFRGNYCCVEATTGDAFAIAYRAGADLENMEMMVINTAPLSYNFEGTGPTGQAGAKFLNARDEDFMPRYNALGSSAEINHIVQAMAQEHKKGNGPPFYFDFRPLPDRMEGAFINFFGGWMPRNLIRLRETGIRLFRSKAEWAPALQTLRGGITTDINCMSNIEGLFAGGTAQSMGPGLFNGWSSGKSIWSGSTAGTSAAQYLKDVPAHKLDPDQIMELKNALFNREIDPDRGEKRMLEITRRLQRCMFAYDVSILKHEESLKRAMKEADAIKEDDMQKAKVQDIHDFITFKETENMLFTMDLFLKASLIRKESRSDHMREDFPEADKDWLKWIVFNKELKDGYRFEELPWDRYRFQPDDLE